MWGLGEPIGRQLGIKCFLVGGIFCRNQAFSTCCAILCKCGSLFCGCCKNSKCLIISELQCFVELISPPEKMFQNYKSKEDNVISLSFCVVLLGSVAPAVWLNYSVRRTFQKSLTESNRVFLWPFLRQFSCGRKRKEEKEGEKHININCYSH